MTRRTSNSGQHIPIIQPGSTHPRRGPHRWEASGYLRAHLSLAGRSDTLFSDDAFRAIHGQARGVPRAINRLAITALLAAYAAGKTIVDESSACTALSEEAAAATD